MITPVKVVRVNGSLVARRNVISFVYGGVKRFCRVKFVAVGENGPYVNTYNIREARFQSFSVSAIHDLRIVR